MKLLCTLAFSGVIEALRPGFEAAQGVRLRTEFAPTAVLVPRLQAGGPQGGEAADVAILTADAIEALVGAGLLQGRMDVGRSFVGVAVRAGAARPDITTAELAARGEVELAVQQVSELLVVPGVDVVGRLPAALGGETVFSGGVLTGSGRPTLAAALLRAVAGAGGLLREKGLEAV